MVAYILKSFIRYIKSNKKDEILHMGELNPDKVFYVIHPDNDEKVGLFAYVTLAMGHMAYARRKGYIPIVDMQNYSNTYLRDEQIGKVNAWEYYFYQPDDYSLSDVYKSKNVIISKGAPICWPDASTGFCFGRLIQNYWRKVLKQNIRIKESILDDVLIQKEKLFADEKKILGVKCRGTDYLQLKPKWHPRQPDPEDVIKKAKIILKQKNISKIFLSTEDKDIYSLFEKEFGDKLISNEQMRYDYRGKGYISELTSGRADDLYLQGYEYLITTILLSECKFFVGGRNGGTVATLLLTKGFEYQYVWNLGRY